MSRDNKNNQNDFRINEDIKAPEVRLSGENVENSIFPTATALKMAQEMQLDLIEIAPQGAPPVCRIADYNKFLFERKQREKELKSNTIKSVLKQIQFTPNTTEHDFDFKVKHAERFLTEENAKVRALIQFKGRAIVFKERGEILLLKFAERLMEVGVAEQLPQLEGRKMFITIAPKKRKN